MCSPFPDSKRLHQKDRNLWNVDHSPKTPCSEGSVTTVPYEFWVVCMFCRVVCTFFLQISTHSLSKKFKPLRGQMRMWSLLVYKWRIIRWELDALHLFRMTVVPQAALLSQIWRKKAAEENFLAHCVIGEGKVKEKNNKRCFRIELYYCVQRETELGRTIVSHSMIPQESYWYEDGQ